MISQLDYVTDRNQMSQATPKPSGRPRSLALRRKAIAAAHDMLMNEGFGRLSIEAVASRSGVGKPTLYRYWANASELAMAALMEGQPEPASNALDTLQTSLERQVSDLVRAFSTTRGRQITLALASADPESEMTRAFRNRVILSSRKAGESLIRQAVERGEITEVGSLETVLDMIYAPIFYRLLVGHLPLDERFAKELVAMSLVVLRHRD